MSSERLTGTDDRPIERIPDDPSTFGRWVVAVGGPAVWITHFMVVYLAGEVACVSRSTNEWTFLSGDGLVLVTVIATVVAVLACAGLAFVARRRMATTDRETIDFAFLGFLLSVGSIIGVVAVGAPALVLSSGC